MSVSAQRHAIMRELEAFHQNAFQTRAIIGGAFVTKRGRYVVDETHPDGSAIIRMEVQPYKPWESFTFTAQQYQDFLSARAAEKERNRQRVAKKLGTATE